MVAAGVVQPSHENPVSGTYALIGQATVEAMLHKRESTGRNGTTKWYSNSLASVQPIEDRHSTHALSAADIESLMEAASAGLGNTWRVWHKLDSCAEGARWIISSVIDGFAGPVVADTINRVLHASLPFALGCANETEPQDLERIIKKVYQDIDHPIRSAPHGFIKPDPTSHSTLPPGAHSLPASAGLLHPLSGAMANTVLVDLIGRQVYVANLGDCRAVVGTQDESGSWICKPMSEDQAVKNGQEVQALIARHPTEQASDIMTSDGLIKRMSAQTRHFGKAHLKAPRAGLAEALEALGEPLSESFLDQTLDGVPYILSTPVVRSLSLGTSEGRVRAIILATDGLWDKLSSEETVLLVAQHLSGDKQDISKKDLPSKIKLRIPTNDRPHPDDAFPGTEGRDQGNWTFIDDNPATLLVRNAIGDGDTEVRRMVLSLGPPMGRAMRDDMTVTVVLFD